MNLSTDVKDLIKCILRRNPDQRYNIKQVLEHPAIQSRIDEFNKPITEDQYALLINFYMQNCGMSNKRDHPEEIKKYKESRKDLDPEYFDKHEAQGNANFFDDISVNFPTINSHSPMLTPFFGTDPGFFDDIPASRFKKSRGEIKPQTFTSNETINWGNNILNPAQTPSLDFKKTDSFTDSRTQQPSKKNIPAPMQNESKSNPASTREIYTSLLSNNQQEQQSLRNVYLQQKTGVEFRSSNEHPDDKTNISVKRIPVELPPTRPYSNQYTTDHKQMTPTRQFNVSENNTGPISNQITVNKSPTKGHPPLNKPKTGEPTYQISKNQSHDTNNTKLVSNTQNYPNNNPVPDSISVRFVNYQASPQNIKDNQPTIKTEPSKPLPSINEFTTDKNQNISNEAVRYFPYEIHDGNKSIVFTNLNEKFNKKHYIQTHEEKPPNRITYNFSAEQLPRNSQDFFNPKIYRKDEKLPPRIVVNSVTQGSNTYSNNNMTFINHKDSENKPQTITYQVTRQPQYTVGNKNMPLVPPQQIKRHTSNLGQPLNSNNTNDSGPSKYANVQYVDYFHKDKPAPISNPVQYQFGKTPQSDLTQGVKTTTVYLANSRPISTEKKREGSIDPGQGTGRNYIKTYHKK